MKLTLIIHGKERILSELLVNGKHEEQHYLENNKESIVIIPTHKCNITVAFRKDNLRGYKESALCCFVDMISGEFDCQFLEKIKSIKVVQISVDFEMVTDEAVLEFDSCGNIIQSTVRIKDIEIEEKEDKQLIAVVKRYFFFPIAVIGAVFTIYYGSAVVEMVGMRTYFPTIIIGIVVVLLDILIIWLYRKLFK